MAYLDFIEVKELATSPEAYEVTFHSELQGQVVDYNATSTDTSGEGRAIYALLMERIEAGKVTPKPYDWAAHWESAFNSKKSELKNEASLSNQSYDALTDEQKTEIQDYYAALDALVFSGDTEFTAWPAKPEFL